VCYKRGMSDIPDLILYETRYLTLVDRNGWFFVRRPGLSGVVTMIALTDAGNLVFVEQHRAPLGKNCFELPAGLAGDDPTHEGEPLEEAARRELLEETGYLAAKVSHLFDGATSPGMTDEAVSFFLCTGLTKQHAGGGVEGESIIVHEVPLRDATNWLLQKQAEGHAVAAKAFAGILFATRAATGT
jgi:ADP-ribose pyrophosphatase